MTRRRLALVAVVAASGALLVPSAEAKFGLKVTVEPARPIVRIPARVVLRTDITLARDHRIRLFAVGPWRNDSGQAFFEIRLTRTAPRTFTGRARFPYPGRWHLDIPASGASPPFDMWVTVRRPG